MIQREQIGTIPQCILDYGARIPIQFNRNNLQMVKIHILCMTPVKFRNFTIDANRSSNTVSFAIIHTKAKYEVPLVSLQSDHPVFDIVGISCYKDNGIT